MACEKLEMSQCDPVFVTYEVFQGSKLCSDEKNNRVLVTANGILCWIAESRTEIAGWLDSNSSMRGEARGLKC